MAAEQLLEIALYFDERVDPQTQEKMSLQDVADKLVVYPLHYFKGKHDITLDYPLTAPHTVAYNTRGLLVLYSHLVSDPHIAYLQDLKEQGYIKSWAVFPPGTWQSYFEDKQKARG
jgi:hypothetical protein